MTVTENDPAVVKDFTFITGVGKHSKRPFEPVLRPAAQDMLLDEFDPPLATHFFDGNAGRLQVRNVRCSAETALTTAGGGKAGFLVLDQQLYVLK